jgi:hypothetical protein
VENMASIVVARAAGLPHTAVSGSQHRLYLTSRLLKNAL